jgi:hypothetical protein
MPRIRLRLLTAAGAAFACGIAPAAPLPASHAAPGAWAPTLAATSAFDNLSAFKDGTAYATVGVVSSGYGNALPDEVPAVPADTAGYFKSSDFGRTWTPMPPPAHAGWAGTTNLYVRFATPTIGYATYNGQTDLPPDPTGKLGPQLCLSLSTTFRTVDGGTTWRPICEPHLAGGRSVTPSASPLAVGKDGTTVLVTGYAGSYDPDADCEEHPPVGYVHFSTNGGQSWRRGALPRGYLPGWTARVYDRTTALVTAYKYHWDADCGGQGDANAVFLTTDAGRTYRRILTCSKQPLCTGAAFASKTRILVGTTDGTTYRTEDGGRTWRKGERLFEPANQASIDTDPQRQWWYWVQSFSFADAKHGYASTRGSGTWRTANGGVTWHQERSHECVYHPFGVGENAAATPDRAVTGGPTVFSAREPAEVDPGGCTPTTANVPVAPGAVAARVEGLTVRLDGTVAR